VLGTFIYRVDPGEEIVGVLKLMHEHPERFSPEIRETLRRHNEYEDGPRWSPEELEEHRQRQAVDRQEATLEAVLELKRQLADLHEYVQEMVREAAARKRGFFG
jgi:hypothetical protein